MELYALRWINDNWHKRRKANAIFKAITLLGECGAFWFFVGFVLFCIPTTRNVSVAMYFSLGVCLAVVTSIKWSVRRSRPYQRSVDITMFVKGMGLKPIGPSFPSGHSATSVVCAAVVCLQIGGAALPLVLIAVTIAFSRIFLCVHYTGDVFCGTVIGATVAAITRAYDLVPIIMRSLGI